MILYFVQRRLSWGEGNKRTCVLHDHVYHGEARRRNQDPFDVGPTLMNANRDPLLLSRSVTYLPHVFMHFHDLIISDAVRKKLIHIGGIEFLQAEFEKGVDLGMPAFGDFSFYEDKSIPKDPAEWFPLLPGINTQHLQPYFEVLTVHFYEVRDQYQDIKDVTVNYGTYNTCACVHKYPISESLMAKHSIVHSGMTVLREDAYEIIAPHLALDFFEIARVDTEDDASPE